MAEDYYTLLGVSRDADEKTIKSAFRKLAMKYHPDKNPGDQAAEKKFKEIGEAYEVLSSDDKRAAYDRFGHAAFQNGAGGAGASGAGGFSAGSFSDIFDDIFGEFMGGSRGGGGANRNLRGADLKYNLSLSLEESFAGKNTTITIPSSEACTQCEGSGAAKGAGPTACGTCGGVGRVRATQGFFTVERGCPTCHGQGHVIKDPCSACAGQGRVQKKRSLSVDIPAGIEGGTNIRLAGEGQAGLRGGPFGDLYLFVTIRDHPLFERDGADLYCAVHVPMTVAALGGDIETPTIDGGRVKLKIPAGSQTGHRFRLRGKGMRILRRTSSGDMFVELIVETPVNLNARQRELLEEFDTVGDREASPESKNFFQKAKKFWDNVKDVS